MSNPSRSLKEALEAIVVQLSAAEIADLDTYLSPVDLSSHADRPYKYVNPVIQLVYDLSSLVLDAMVWAYATRTLTSFTNCYIPYRLKAELAAGASIEFVSTLLGIINIASDDVQTMSVQVSNDSVNFYGATAATNSNLVVGVATSGDCMRITNTGGGASDYVIAGWRFA